MFLQPLLGLKKTAYGSKWKSNITNSVWEELFCQCLGTSEVNGYRWGWNAVLMTGYADTVHYPAIKWVYLYRHSWSTSCEKVSECQSKSCHLVWRCDYILFGSARLYLTQGVRCLPDLRLPLTQTQKNASLLPHREQPPWQIHLHQPSSWHTFKEPRLTQRAWHEAVLSKGSCLYFPPLPRPPWLCSALLGCPGQMADFHNEGQAVVATVCSLCNQAQRSCS